MNNFNNLNQVPIANLSNNELDKIAQLEQEFKEKYYLIAFEKDESQN
ncbi:hypothetical protein AN1V17_01950 [Vallitalea sediminicola]